MARIVGIDLGTTYSVIAYVDEETKNPVIIKNKNNNDTTPSVIGFTEDGGYVIGEDAKLMEELGDVNTASFYKLHMGDHSYKYEFRGKLYTARDLSSLFLKRLISDAEKTVGDKISKAVITVPAYFEDAAKNDTIAAGNAAGVEVLNIINEPTAACVAYGLNSSGGAKNILIYDLGGGTFDVTVASVKSDSIDVLGTTGHHQLGGRDWDKEVADWLVEKFLDETGTDLSDDSEMAAALMVKAEKAKRQLTSARSAEITVDDGNNKRRFTLTRSEFEDLTAFQLGITTDLIDKLFTDINLTWNDIDGAVLVGGSTKMPMVKNFILENNIKILEGVHPDEAVAIGAAIQANISQICAALPGKKEVSSIGMSKKDLDLTLLPGARLINDVIPHSLGMIVENADSSRYINDIMITKNTRCSEAKTTKRRELRVARSKSRNKMDIYLLQGESDEPENCTVAKKYSFYDIDYVEGGKTLLDITFLHTINGTIDIKAVQTETGRELLFKEEEIPEDMTWMTRDPREVNRENNPPVTGALVMALDLSGSMDDSSSGVRAIDAAKKAMRNFVDQFDGMEIKIGIIGFSDEVKVLCAPSNNKLQVRNAISALKTGLTGYGTTADPLPAVFKALKGFAGEPFAYGMVLTDGMWGDSACRSALKAKGNFTKNGIELIGMGFGCADKKFLKSISTREDLASVDDISNLNANLSTIAKVILN